MKKSAFPLSLSPTRHILRRFAWLPVLLLPAGFLSAQCNPDIVPPVVTPPADMTISSTLWESLDIDLFNPLPKHALIVATFGDATHLDNCDGAAGTVQESYAIYGPPGPINKIRRTFYVKDSAGNTGSAQQYVTILPTYVLHVPAWQYLGQSGPDSMHVAGDPSQVVVGTEDSVYAAPCPGGYSKIEHDWIFVDWAYAPINPNMFQDSRLPALDRNNDGIVGDAYDIIAIGDSIWLYENNAPGAFLMPRNTALYYYQNIYNSYVLRGTVFLDTLLNCAPDAGEPGLPEFKVKAVGPSGANVYTTFTGGQGQFELLICTPDSSVELGLDLPYNYGGSCPSTYLLDVGAAPATLQDIAVPLNGSCNLLTVDIGTWRIRPCFTGNYSVDYCNYSDHAIAGTYVEVLLDTFLHYDSATLAGAYLGGNTYRFETGDLGPGECGQFQLYFSVDCDAPTGLTHCTEAHIYPVDACPPALPWSGAELRATGICDGDSVRFQIKNIGGAAMANPLDFVVTEDLIMAKTLPYQLGMGGTFNVSEPANGATWRLETPQEPGHPWGGVVAAVVEGCGGFNTPGLVNVFPINDRDPFNATDCTQNTSGYDPNDKQAFPAGYAAEHYVRANTDLEYLIRFQNTGTDTAFNIVVLDTLSALLDPASVRPGAASHPFDFSILDGNVLRFRFNEILLPDSNVNEAASQGFVKFRVAQRPDNLPGAEIFNRAGIYFDFNPVVLTNTTWHTVGDNFIAVSTDETAPAKPALRVYPNPSAGAVWFEAPAPCAGGTFRLIDGLGRTVATARFAGETFRFERNLLPPGLYFFVLAADNGALFSGKIRMQ